MCVLTDKIIVFAGNFVKYHIRQEIPILLIPKAVLSQGFILIVMA